VNYEVQIKLTADASYTTFLTTTTSYTAVGLTPGSSYDVRIRTRCSSVNSDYTTPLTFPTQADAACAAPTGLAVTNITANAARLSWNAVAGATQYEVNYRLIGAVEWIERLVTGTVDNLTNLQAGSRYEFRVAAICGTVNGAFPNPIPFQTSTGTSNCVISPDNVRVTSITPTTAVVTWDAVVPSQGYQVEIRRVGAANWTNDPNVFTNSKSFSGLVAGTSYDVRVRTVCARSGTGFPTQNSGYSQELRINTPLSRDARAASAIGGFGLFPNPNNGVFTVTFFTERSGVADLAVYDVTGREVIRAEVVTNTGRNEMPVNLTGYARGVYTVRFIFEGAIQSAKVELH
jgi:hypothetical protein